MKSLYCILFFFICSSSFAQTKTFKAIQRGDSILRLDLNGDTTHIVYNCPKESTVYSNDSILTFRLEEQYDYSNDPCKGYRIIYRFYVDDYTRFRKYESCTLYILRKYPEPVERDDDDFLCLLHKKTILRKDKLIIFFEYKDEYGTIREFEIFYSLTERFDYKLFYEEMNRQLKTISHFRRNYYTEYFSD